MKYKINAEVEATPEEVAELIKRVGNNWAEATVELAIKGNEQLAANWPKTMEEFFQSFGVWGR